MSAPGFLGEGITVAQMDAFRRDGYLVLRNVIPSDQIEIIRKAANRAEERWRADPNRSGSDEAYLRRVEPLIEYGNEFVELLDHPAYFPLVRELLGSGVAILDTAYFITPPDSGWGQTSEWHIDEGLTGPIGAPIPLMLKVSLPLDIIGGLDDGPTAVLPGSHRNSYKENPPAGGSPLDMSGKVPILVSPGDALIFHGRIYHAAMPNVGERTRRVLHYNYGHIWMKPWPGHEPSSRLRESASTATRRQLLHVSDHHYQDRLPGAVL